MVSNMYKTAATVEFYKKCQSYLRMKEKEYGELRYISSSATHENIEHIREICSSIKQISYMCGIPTKGANLTNEMCVHSYKYLVMSTNFKNHERLGEDIVNGSVINMLGPFLSPYMLIKILWYLEYEKIMVESFLHFPLDVCTEILEICRKCLEELPFQRSIDIIFESIPNVYVRFLQLKDIGVQSRNVEESVQNLMANFNELVLLLSNPKITRLTELPPLKKYERSGILLKRLIRTIKKCLEYKRPNIPVSADREKLFAHTFGNEPFVKYEESVLEETMIALKQGLMDLLLEKIKEIDCNVYIGWAELDDNENNEISLQRAIGNECYYFIDFLNDDVELSRNSHLIECLQQFSSKPDVKQSNFVLSLQELCHAVENGEEHRTKELICRYKEWDNSMVDFIYKNKSCLDKDDCFSLLEYLIFVITQSDDENFKRHSHDLITKILLLQSIPDIYEIVVRYIVKHDGKNHLEFHHMKEMFNDFIMRNLNLRTPKNLRIILLFLLNNAKLVLTALIKITIGHPEYGNIMISPNDLLLLAPFMAIREENNQTLLINVLRTICTEDVEWNTKKFMNFLHVSLDNSLIGVDDLINYVFIPYLESDTFAVSNINSILNNIRMLEAKSTDDTNIEGLLIVLGKKMTSLRKNRVLLKYASSEIFANVTRILNYFLEIRREGRSVRSKKIIEGIEAVVEPVDILYFAPLWLPAQKSVGVIEILEDYERRRFSVASSLQGDPRTSNELQNYLSDLQREDFLRHLIVQSTEAEYHKFASETTVMYWFMFGWNDEYEAYDNFLRLTIEACRLSLECPSIGPKDLFVFLLKSLTRFSKVYVQLDGMKCPDKVHQSLVQNAHLLNGSVQRTCYADLFATFIAQINNKGQDSSWNLLEQALNAFESFADQCVAVDRQQGAEACNSSSSNVLDFYVAHEIISAFIKVPSADVHECITRMSDLFALN